MLISGSGITTPIELKLGDYKFDIQLSLDWFKMGNGNYKASDRGPASDHISCDISTFGKKDYIDGLIAALMANQKIDGKLTLTEIEEPIFGHHVDYTKTVTAVLSKIDIKNQRALNSFGLNITLKAADIEFLAPVNVLPSLLPLMHDYEGDTEWTFETNESYYNMHELIQGEININRFEADAGKFMGTFKFTPAQMKSLLDFQKGTRSGAFELPTIPGVPKPFGDEAGAGPYNVKLYALDSITRISPLLWTVKLTFVQEI